MTGSRGDVPGICGAPSTSLEEKTNAGIVMMLMNAAGIAAFNAWAVPPAGNDILRISWIAS